MYRIPKSVAFILSPVRGIREALVLIVNHLFRRIRDFSSFSMLGRVSVSHAKNVDGNIKGAAQVYTSETVSRHIRMILSLFDE